MNEQLQPEVKISHESLPNGALEGTHELIQGLIKELESSREQGGIEDIGIDYRIPAKAVLEKFPKQVAVMVALSSPGSNIGQGLLNPEKTHLVVGRRSPERAWGGGTWALPMGKIELKDVAESKQSLGEVIAKAAFREFDEEVKADKAAGQQIVAGSFQDTKTETIIHVVLRTIGENRTGNDNLEVKLPDAREHEALGWISLEGTGKLQPMMPGTAYALKVGLTYLDQRNREVKASGRYQDQI